MTTWIALLRGVNVGGRNKLLMADLASELHKIGLLEVKTYIQSGNVVFSTPPQDGATLAKEIGEAIQTKWRFRPHVIVLSKDDFEKAARANPFQEAQDEADGKTLHLFFLDQTPASIDRAALDAVKTPSESWHYAGRTFYFHAPDGFHASRLGAKAERILAANVTVRNWRTVSKLLEMVNGPDDG